MKHVKSHSIPAGHMGMLSLITTEIFFFAALIAVYLAYIGKSLSGPTPEEVLSLDLVAFNTIALLTSSFTVVVALKSLRKGMQKQFQLWLLVTVLLGMWFLIGTAIEWRGLIASDDLTLQTNLFGTTFYTLVGFHAFHVTCGVCILTGIWVAGMLGWIKTEHHQSIEYVSWYWHFVDCVWIVVFLVVYVIGR